MALKGKPNSYKSLIRNFAKASGKSVREVDKKFQKAMEVVQKKLRISPKDKNFYRMVVGMLKKWLGITDYKKESFDIEKIFLRDCDNMLKPHRFYSITENIISNLAKQYNLPERKLYRLYEQANDKIKTKYPVYNDYLKPLTIMILRKWLESESISIITNKLLEKSLRK